MYSLTLNHYASEASLASASKLMDVALTFNHVQDMDDMLCHSAGEMPVSSHRIWCNVSQSPIIAPEKS